MSDQPRFRRGPGARRERQNGETPSFLRLLDPSTWEPGYWSRFHRRVMEAAGGELARRQVLADLTVGEVVLSWARALVPTAVFAAAAAFFVLLNASPGAGVTDVPAGVEELLVDGLEGIPVPLVLTSAEDLEPDVRIQPVSETSESF